MWLAVHLLDLPVAVFRDAEDPAGAAPLAVSEQHAVIACNSAAQAAGVRIGQSTATARALCASLRLQPRAVEQELALLHALGEGLQRYTPTVCPLPPATLVLEIGGSLHLFGELPTLCQNLRQLLSQQQLSLRTATAPTPLAAALLAQAGEQDDLDARQDWQELLARLPLACLPLSVSQQERLRHMGFSQLRDILRLPRAALGRRLGRDLLLLCQRLLGERPHLLPALPAVEHFERHWDCPDGIPGSEGLRFPMRRLLQTLSTFLITRQESCQHLVWTLSHDGEPATRLDLYAGRPHTDAATWERLSQLRLERLTLPAAVTALTLSVPERLPLPLGNLSLLPELQAAETRQEQQQALLAQLRARLGAERCRQWQPCDDHRPEAAQHPGPTPTATADLPRPTGTAPLPLWLLPRPQAITRLADGQLLWQGRLTLLHGPRRLATQWWDRPVERDYYTARHDSGALYWLYHDREHGDWFVQGVFG